jgi:predicted RNase H-like HicB family nuclease
MSTYTVFFEPTATGYSAHVPHLPGCVAAAATLEETRRRIREAIEFHIEGVRINGDVVPEPTPLIEQIEVSAQPNPAYGLHRASKTPAKSRALC